MSHKDFESMERDNERQPMVSHQSETTPKTVANDWSCVMEMKSDAMDEAYGMAGKRGTESSISKAHSQFREYGWS